MNNDLPLYMQTEKYKLFVKATDLLKGSPLKSGLGAPSDGAIWTWKMSITPEGDDFSAEIIIKKNG